MWRWNEVFFYIYNMQCPGGFYLLWSRNFIGVRHPTYSVLILPSLYSSLYADFLHYCSLILVCIIGMAIHLWNFVFFFIASYKNRKTYNYDRLMSTKQENASEHIFNNTNDTLEEFKTVNVLKTYATGLISIHISWQHAEETVLVRKLRNSRQEIKNDKDG